MKKSLRDKIIKLTNQGIKPAEIAKATGASLSYIYVVRCDHKKRVPPHILDMLKPETFTISVTPSRFARIKKFFGV